METWSVCVEEGLVDQIWDCLIESGCRQRADKVERVWLLMLCLKTEFASKVFRLPQRVDKLPTIQVDD